VIAVPGSSTADTSGSDEDSEGRRTPPADVIGRHRTSPAQCRVGEGGSCAVRWTIPCGTIMILSLSPWDRVAGVTIEVRRKTQAPHLIWCSRTRRCQAGRCMRRSWRRWAERARPSSPV